MIEETDITNNNIWPAIGQHLRHELKRGVDDKKRSGTKNDHYRKCWELYCIPGTEWINSWAGWDAFTDRGEQLVYSKNLIQLLGQKFKKYHGKISSNDFKKIAKITVKYLPTLAKNPANIESMADNKLDEIAKIIYNEFVKEKEAED